MDLLPGADRLPSLSSERLLLRAVTPADVPALFSVFGDPEVCRYWSRPALPDPSAAAALQEEIARCFRERSLFQWAIAESEDGPLVGTCTLAALSAEHRRAEVGFALGRAVWGRGYVAEVLPTIVRFAFEVLDLHRLEADVDPRNARSIRALERAGFTREGHQRERYWQCGEWQDALLYGLLRRDWMGRAAQLVSSGAENRPPRTISMAENPCAGGGLGNARTARMPGGEVVGWHRAVSR